MRYSLNRANPYLSKNFNFQYFKSPLPQLERLKIAIALFLRILRQRPNHVFWGHIKLAPLVGIMSQYLNIPYTVITYGKEVWEPLTPRTKTILRKAAGIWTISRYTRKLACSVNQLDEAKFKMLPPAIDGERLTPGEKSPILLQRYGLTGKKVLMSVARLWSGDIYKGVSKSA